MLAPGNTAAWINGKHARLEVGPAPYTRPGDGQIVVRNHAVAVNPLDWIIQVEGNLTYRWLNYPPRGWQHRLADCLAVAASPRPSGPACTSTLAAKLYVETATTDADLFLVLRAFAPDGTEVVFQEANDPRVPVAQGWLRASHRALDDEQSRPFLPVHRHDRTESLNRGTVYELDVEILPTSLVLPAGYTLTLDVQGHDYGSFPHNDPRDRPADVYGCTVTLHAGAERASYLLLPVIRTR